MTTSARHKTGGRPTKAQSEALDRLVLDGARDAFGRAGIAATSVDDLAVQLGISKHTIYRRYPSKDTLLEAVVLRDLGLFADALRKAPEGISDPLEVLRLQALCYVKIGSSTDYAGFYLSLMAQAAVSPPLRTILATWSAAALSPLIQSIGAAQTAGVLKAGSPELLCDLLIDLLEGVNNRVRLRGAAISSAEDVDYLFALRWKAFLSYASLTNPG